MGFQPLKLEGNLRNSLWPAIACDQGLSQQYSLNRTTEHAQMRMRGLVRDIRDIWICPNAEMLFGNNFWWAFMAAIKCTCRIISTSNTSSLMALTCHESWFAPIHHPLIWEAHLTYLMPFRLTSQSYHPYPSIGPPTPPIVLPFVGIIVGHTSLIYGLQIKSLKAPKHTFPNCYSSDPVLEAHLAYLMTFRSRAQKHLSDPSTSPPIVLPSFPPILQHHLHPFPNAVI